MFPSVWGRQPPDLRIETAAGKRRCAANQWKSIWKGRRRAKKVNRLCKMNSEAQKLTMTDIHLVQIYGHTAQVASTTQVNAMCKNIKMGTVIGKTQACATSTAAWFFGEKRWPQTATRVEQVREWWRGFNVDARRRIRKVWGKKSHFGKRPQTLEPSYRPILCHHLFGVGGGLEAEYTRLLASARRQCYSGWRFVQQGADHRQFLLGYGNANMEKSGWAFAQFGHGKRYHHRFCQEGQVSTDQRGKFHGCTCAGCSCLWSHQRTLPACGWIYSQPIFLCSLRPESFGHQEA